MSHACIDAATPDWLAPLQPWTASAAAMERWTCIRTHPQAERWAAANLRQAGYETFLPLVPVRRRDRTVPTMSRVVSVPLFGSYLFVRHDPSSSWTPIRTTPGVKAILRCGQKMAYCSDMAVEAVRSVVDGAEALAALRTHSKPRRAPGEAVAPITGPFAGHPGVVLQVGKEMVLISLLVFGSLRSVLVQADNLAEREV